MHNCKICKTSCAVNSNIFNHNIFSTMVTQTGSKMNVLVTSDTLKHEKYQLYSILMITHTFMQDSSTTKRIFQSKINTLQQTKTITKIVDNGSGHFEYDGLWYSFFSTPFVFSTSCPFLRLEHMQTTRSTIAITTIAVTKLEPATATPRYQICTYPLIVVFTPAITNSEKKAQLNIHKGSEQGQATVV